ncbi:uncharacterized protein RCC_04294 [Ramularia collo-cygni]|uniref:Cyclochlorotine biosynthesis protein O n=1 Tax=Ramularia collo-cygni TaxID=112498 RepID=A0A2D3VA91_9PEZI|nr:uncharacterized protein RCC_04294 [Ramularia collo-cygni]CZT18449.1 uncharacterized protein RCC_04294 [Ramularia collo-cygni]
MKFSSLRWNKFHDEYSKLNHEQSDSSSSDPMSVFEASQTSARHGQWSGWLEWAARVLSVLIFVSGMIMMLIAGQQCKTRSASDKECAAQTSVWFPVLGAVEYEYRDWVDSSATTHSKYISDIPSLALEHRWHRLENMPAVLIPSERIPTLNRSIVQDFLRANPPHSDKYIAGIEVFHHLHCLNILRQVAWKDRYPTNLVPSLLRHNSPAVASKHADHCIETLRQALTCNADVTPYLWYRRAHVDGTAKEDFAASHKCKNFEKIVEWVKENGVQVPLEATRGDVATKM